MAPNLQALRPSPPASGTKDALDSLPGNVAKKPTSFRGWMMYFHVTKGRVVDWAVFAAVGLCYLAAATIIIARPAEKPAAKGTLV